MLRKISLALVLILTTSQIGFAHHTSESAAPAKSLYQRLGGYDAIAAVVDDFIGRMINDPKLARFFTGFSTNSKMRIRQHIVDQICAATGGPCVYVGRDMKSAHAGAGITEADWNAAVGHLVATLDKFKVGERERTELLTAISSFKNDIVEKK